MADRGHYRGGRGSGGHPRGARGGRGGGRGGHGADSGASGGTQQQERERPKKENILDLAKYVDKRITVKFNGGREGMPFLPSLLLSCYGSPSCMPLSASIADMDSILHHHISELTQFRICSYRHT